MHLGIDFGTTRTVVAAAASGRYPVASFATEHGFADYVPGFADWTGDGWRFGWDARPGCAIRSIKRIVGRLAPDDLVPDAPVPITALELATGYLTYLRQLLVADANLELDPEEPLRATVAVPANASTRQRYLTLEAFGRAGFEVAAMHNEPSAAAVELAHRNVTAISPRSPKRYVVVYDLGGGTFDTAAVSLEQRRFELITSEGIAELGGDDFDEQLLELTGWTGAPIARAAALERCREAKESLGPNSRKLLVELPDSSEPVAVDTAALYDRCQPLVDRTLDRIDALFARLADHGIDPDNVRELGGVYLVGGAAAFPPVARALRGRYKRKLQLAPQPHAATAIGLAICGDPEADIFVREATTRHFGVWREADGGHEKVFDRLLGKDVVSDDGVVIAERIYRPTHRIGSLRFLECADLTADGQPAGDVTPWTRVLFPYDPELAERDDLAGLPVERTGELAAEIAETYTYRPGGTIEVAIANRTHGYRRQFVLGAMR